MTNETKCWCQHCKKELPPSHTGPCPHCGKTGKDCKVPTGGGVVGIKGSLSVTHKPKWSSESLALFFGFLAIFLAVVIPGILLLFPFVLWFNFAILVGFLVVAGFIFWWQRYRVLMLIQRLERKFGGEKTM